MKLPKQYEWLSKETGPRLLVTALQHYGTAEVPGAGNNPSIMAWAKATGQTQYVADEIPWCGLFVCYVVMQAGWSPVKSPLLARSWRKFGVRAKTPMLGDILVFWRGSPSSASGHVGFYVGEDKTHYHVLGGNQANRSGFARIEKGRLLEARRCKWRINQPANVRVIKLAAKGQITANEA